MKTNHRCMNFNPSASDLRSRRCSLLSFVPFRHLRLGKQTMRTVSVRLRFRHSDFSEHIFQNFILRLETFREFSAVHVIVFPLVLFYGLSPFSGLDHAAERVVPKTNLLRLQALGAHHAAWQIEHNIESLLFESWHGCKETARPAHRADAEDADFLRFEERQEIAGRHSDDIDVSAEQCRDGVARRIVDDDLELLRVRAGRPRKQCGGDVERIAARGGERDAERRRIRLQALREVFAVSDR